MSRHGLYLFLLTLIAASWVCQCIALYVVGDVASDRAAAHIDENLSILYD